MEQHVLRAQKRAVEFTYDGRLETAEYLFLQALEMDGGQAGYSGLGWFYGFTGQDREAIRAFRRGLACSPQSGDLCNELGVFLLRRDRVHRAIAWLNRALRSARCRNRHLAFYNLALAFGRLNRPERSRRYLRLALRDRPGFVEALDFLKELDAVA